MRNREELKQKLHGCYITIPTLFNDPDLSINEDDKSSEAISNELKKMGYT